MKARTSISIPKEIQEKVERYAAATKRSVSAVIELAVEDFLRRDDVRNDLKVGGNDEPEQGAEVHA